MQLRMSHLFGGMAGGVAFGVAAGLLLGSCVFEDGPNHAVATGKVAAMEGGAQAETSTPGGMDPGATAMEGVFTRIAQLKQAIEDNPRDRASLIELGNLYYDANKFDAAIGFYEQAAAIDRADPNLLTDLANCYMFVRDSPRALELLQEVQERYPSHWQSAANLFFLAASLRDAPLAGDALGRLKRLNPGFEKIPQMEKIYEDLHRGGRS